VRHGGSAEQRLWLGPSGYLCGCERRVANTNTHHHPDGNSDSNCHADGDTHADSNSYIHTNSNSYCYSDGCSYCYTKRYSYGYTLADTYTYWHAQADAHAEDWLTLVPRRHAREDAPQVLDRSAAER